MASKHNVVKVRIAYLQHLHNRDSFDDELQLVLALNRLMDQHRVLTDHIDSVQPRVTVNDSGIEQYGVNIDLKFHVRHRKGKLYEYTRLHYVLNEISELCDRFAPKFIKLERYIDLESMNQPWVQVCDRQQVLLRKGATQFQFPREYTPGYVLNHQQIDGLVVMGEPGAVDHFRRVWTRIARNYYEAQVRTGEWQSLEASGYHHGMNIDIASLKANYPDIKWEHLLIWAHAKGIAEEGWFVINLDPSDQWVLAGIQYANINKGTLMTVPLKYKPFMTKGDVEPFFGKLELATIESTATADVPPVVEEAVFEEIVE